MNFSNFAKKVNHYLGVKIFKSDNLFTYSLYTNLLSYFQNKKAKPVEIQNLFQNGFIDLPDVDAEFISKVNREISSQINDDFSGPIFKYKPTKNLQNILINYLKNDYKHPLKILKNLFKCNVYITTIQLRRTFHFDKTKSLKESVYSENYHCDKYVGTHYKQFVYLNDVNKDNGPFTYLSKNETKKFIKNYKFKNRFSNDITKNDYNESENCFVGEAGSSLLVNTTQCLHRAGIPTQGKYRDVLVITYVASPVIKDPDPMHFCNSEKYNFWSPNMEGHFSKKLAKFKNNRQALVSLIKHINQINKFNDNHRSS